MKDFLAVAVRLQRIELLTRTLVNDLYSQEDKEMAGMWIAELATNMADEVKAKVRETNSPSPGL
ncbi:MULTISPECIES: hypothetical protein [Pantoea]|uniref:hypothetical protein n=1 Tax=Pantoea TaxID=53335 RepID=UPI001653F282|nr:MULTISPECIES: hypothetical protein [Pantoea]MBK5015038.1 hypothetical protein [Pantoea sp. S62]